MRETLAIVDAVAGVTLVQAVAVFAAWTLGTREPFLRKYLGLFVSAAVGVLLATALLHLMPEAIAQLGNRQAVWMVAGGTMIALFCAERIFIAVTGVTAEPATPGDCAEYQQGGHGVEPRNIVAASMLHSFVDGAAVAAAFAAGSRIGWLTAFAIALHETPHRMGDFALFVHLKVPLPRALRLAVLAGLPSLLGVGFVAVMGLGHVERMAWLLPVSAATFLYISSVNLIPELGHELLPKGLTLQIASLCAGVLLVVVAAGLFPF